MNAHQLWSQGDFWEGGGLCVYVHVCVCVLEGGYLGYSPFKTRRSAPAFTRDGLATLSWEWASPKDGLKGVKEWKGPAKVK